MNKLLQRIYPFLIAIYPVLALRNFNSDYVDFSAIARSLVLVFLLALLIWAVTFAIFRKVELTGVITSLVMLIILGYGHIYLQIEKSFGPPRHSVLSILLGGSFIVLSWLLIKRPSTAQTVSQFLANVAVILILMTLGQMIVRDAQAVRAAKSISQTDQAPTANKAHAGHPDIYVLLLDGHGRTDVLQEEFGYDDSSFIQSLTDMGFYVAQCSQSNYASTRYSLTSMFQMDYIQIVDGEEQVPALKDTPVLQTLRADGYKVITFENSASGHFDFGEDLRYSRNQLAFGAMDLSGGLNEFEKTMLSTTIARMPLDTEIIPSFNETTITRLEFYEHYLQVNYILKKLPETTQLPGPKFVFAHILVPHIPQVFTPDGGFRFPEDKSKNGYRDNAEFIDKAILPVIQQILADSPTPPVIIVMGDHGPPATGLTHNPAARMKNLDAYFVDSKTMAKLYDTITPVNSFRILLDSYFGADYPLLQDTSYYAYQLRQLKQPPTVMPNTCK